MSDASADDWLLKDHRRSSVTIVGPMSAGEMDWEDGETGTGGRKVPEGDKTRRGDDVNL